MNVSEYIESGILDAYVLGGLSKEEALEVERQATLHPEISKEIEDLRSTFEEVLITQQVIPPLALKNRILEAIEDQENKAGQSKVVSLFHYANWVMAASWIVGLFFCGMSYYYRVQWKQTEAKVLALETRQQELASQFNLTKQEYSEANRKLSFVSDTTIKWVALNKLPNKPEAFAKVIWDPSKGDLYLNAKYLPQAPLGKQYQLWAIVDGKPVDAGIVPYQGGLEFIKMKQIKLASAFAITLEKKGGSSVPNLGEMYVMGGV